MRDSSDRMRGLRIPAFLITLSLGYVVSNVQVLNSERQIQNAPPVPLGLPRQSDRVIVVVLDGVPVRVGYDKNIMPFVVELAASGASGVSRAPEETLTPAGVRALATGQNPSVADALGMFRETEYKGWTVFDDVVRRGESVSLSGDKAWTSLLASRDPGGVRVTDIETRLYQHTQRVLEDVTARIESATPPTLVVVHLSETDKLGHLYGTENPEYKKRMRAIDDQLRAFVKRVVTPNATLVITADHGNDVFGSHGGEEDVYRNVPIVMTGRGIQTGAKIRMDARALPGVLAVLLGTRIPAEMQAVIPAQAFALTDSERSALVKANAQQLQHLSEMRGVELSASMREGLRKTGEPEYDSAADSALGTGRRILTAVVVALDAASPVSIPRILWALVLFSGLFIVALEMLWPANQLRGVTDMSLWIVMGLVIALLALSSLAVPVLWLILAIELVLLTSRLVLAGLGAALLGFAAAVFVALLPAIRFAYMPQIKAVLRTQAGRVASFIVLILGSVSLVALRRGRAVHFPRGAETYFVAVTMLGVVLLTPLSPVPVVLIVLTFTALRAAGVSWTQVALIVAGLAAFFLWSERAGFARYGEAPVPRYIYVAVTCALITAVLLRWAGDQRRWLALAWLSLVPLWPFGYLRIAGSSSSSISAGLLVIIPLGIAAWIGARHLRLWWAYLPLATTVFYHLYPTHPLFWVALATHAAVIGAVAVLPGSDSAQPAVVALTAVSGLILMSPAAVAPSVVLIALGVLAASRIDTRGILPASVTLVSSGLLVFSRYALVSVFSHGQSIRCTLKCIDEASGFLGFDDTQWTWATGLITLKMLLGSALILSFISLNHAFYSAREKLIAATLLLVFGFVAGAAMDAALSFGPYGARLGLSLGQAGYATIILLSWVLGYWAFNSVCRRAIAAIPHPATVA